MKNYLICYYILQQCMFETLEDDLTILLSKMSPESTEDGTPADEKTYKRWKNTINVDTMNLDEIRKAISHRLELTAYDCSKTIELLKTGDIDYYLYQAKERAEEFLQDYAQEE